MTLLEAAGVTVQFVRRTALSGVSLRLCAGELVALVGPNAAGKTTLLEVLLGVRTPSSGVVRLVGAPLHSYAARERARLVTLVPQSTEVRFALRARDVVAIGRTPYISGLRGLDAEDERAIVGALELTGATRLADRRMSELSAGERQRVHLARAFAQSPRVLLLDEPTANLDVLHQLQALEIVQRFVAQGGAALVAIHDLSLAARTASKVILLNQGRVALEGSPGDVLSPSAIQEVFGVRAVVRRDARGRIDHVNVVGAASSMHTNQGNPR